MSDQNNNVIPMDPTPSIPQRAEFIPDSDTAIPTPEVSPNSTPTPTPSPTPQ